ncbi:MAG TPA: carboxypeptidase-like regulatory domain-containing protein [Acidimicrobiales bacterium]|nr:carboxypeptidase-like regulatory domain-containing protein [Acidimicrobiales bacterium]
MASRGIRRLFLFAFAVASVLIVSSTDAYGQSGQGGATVQPDSGPDESSFTVTAGGFKPGSLVQATVDGFIIGAAPATASSNGDASVTFTGFGEGIHRVRLVGIDANNAPRGPSAAFTVKAPLCTSNCSGGLPQTGRGVGLALLGGVLLAGGYLLVTRHPTAGKHFKGAARTAGVVVLAGAVVVTVTRFSRPESAHAASTASIAGKATNGATSEGVPNVCVHAANNSDFGMALTAADGTYTISGLPPGRYNVGFLDCGAAPVFFTEYFGGSRNWRGATAVDVADGQAVTGKDAQLDPGAVIGGRVVDSAGAGLDNTCVWMGTANNAMGCQVATTASGAFISNPIATGTYGIAVVDFDGEFAIKYNGGTNDYDSSSKITLGSRSENTSVRVTLPQAGSISGTIKDAASGSAPTRAVCIADYSNNVPTLASGTAASDGKFTIPQLGAGPHKVRFFDCENDGSDAAYTAEFYNDKPDVGTADPVTVAAGGDRSATDATLASDGEPEPTTTTVAGNTTTTASGATTTTTSGSATTTTTRPATTTTSPQAATTSTTSATPPPANGPASASTASAQPGDTITISGNGFQPGSNVDAVVYSTPVKLGQGRADGAGNISLRVTLPRNLTPGRHELQLQGVDSAGRTRVLNAFITIRGTLPRTGGQEPWQATLGLTLLVLAGLAVFSRRQLSRTTA